METKEEIKRYECRRELLWGFHQPGVGFSWWGPTAKHRRGCDEGDKVKEEDQGKEDKSPNGAWGLDIGPFFIYVRI